MCKHLKRLTSLFEPSGICDIDGLRVRGKQLAICMSDDGCTHLDCEVGALRQADYADLREQYNKM